MRVAVSMGVPGVRVHAMEFTRGGPEHQDCSLRQPPDSQKRVNRHLTQR